MLCSAFLTLPHYCLMLLLPCETPLTSARIAPHQRCCSQQEQGERCSKVTSIPYGTAYDVP